MLSIDWDEIIHFSMSPIEIIIRGTLMYFFLFLVLRFVLRRDVGSVGIGDFLFIVIVADASQNGMSGDAKTIPDAIVLVTTLLVWNYLLDMGSYYFPWFANFAEPPPITLVENGKFKLRNMRREYITKAEILAKLREHEITDVSAVKKMCLERDGEISVIKMTPTDPDRR
jgi:uncharacterized membrane protein YcaP (DUF421 family)